MAYNSPSSSGFASGIDSAPASIQDDLQKYSAYEAPIEQRRTSWSDRRFPLVELAIATILFALHSGLSCASASIGKLLFAFSWTPANEESGTQIRLGSLQRQRCTSENYCVTAFIAEDNFGGAQNSKLFAIWMASRFIVIFFSFLLLLFIALIPHPRNKEAESKVRAFLRLSILLLVAPLPIAYGILAPNLMKATDAKLGIASLCIEAVLIILMAIAAFTASTLVMDPDYVAALDQKRFADKQVQAERDSALAAARQQNSQARRAVLAEKKRQKAVKNIIGKDGMKQLALRQLLSPPSKSAAPTTSAFPNSGMPLLPPQSGYPGTAYGYPPQPQFGYM